MTAIQASAQQKVAVGKAKTELSEEETKKEADALKVRIDQYIIKIEANKDNEKVDYEAEQVRIAKMKEEWETLSGKTWKEEKK